MSLLLRSDKGSPLTHAEMDENWLYSAVQLGQWSTIYNYVPNDFTVYNGIIYRSLTSNQGREPPSHGSDWVTYIPTHSHGFSQISAAVLDEANLSSNSHVHVPTQASVKAYVDSILLSGGYTDAQAKDAVGGAIADTNSISMAYNPTTKILTSNLRLNGTSLNVGASGVKVADNGITSTMLQSGVVTNSKIADGSVGASKLDVANAPSDGYMLSWNNSLSKMQWMALSLISYTDANAIAAVAGVLQEGPGIDIDVDGVNSITISADMSSVDIDDRMFFFGQI